MKNKETKRGIAAFEKNEMTIEESYSIKGGQGLLNIVEDAEGFIVEEDAEGF
ncbi:MAG: hypothetical protein AB8B56_18275 [Crocinitomicaceae bacterium]